MKKPNGLEKRNSELGSLAGKSVDDGTYRRVGEREISVKGEVKFVFDEQLPFALADLLLPDRPRARPRYRFLQRHFNKARLVLSIDAFPDRGVVLGTPGFGHRRAPNFWTARLYGP
jgi:hypothetical protein